MGLKTSAVTAATTTATNAALAAPTSTLIGRRLTRVESSTIAATTASPSNTAHTTSTRPHASGVPSLPIAMPTVRVRTHTVSVATLMPMHASAIERDGRSRIVAAIPTWSHATTAKNVPCVQDTPACSPIMAKWMPAAPSIRPAIVYRNTGPTVVPRWRGR